MFRILSVILIVISFIWLLVFLSKKKISLNKIYDNYFLSFKNLFKEIKLLSSKDFPSKINWLKKFFYLATIFFFILMMLSAFINVIFIGDDLTGLLLLIHVTIAPLFSIFLAVTIILYAHSNSFNKNDISLDQKSLKINRSKLNSNGYLKLIFWLIVFFSLPTMISIILSMFPIFGTEGQEFLLNIHRYSTLIILLLFIFHVALVSSKSNKPVTVSK